MATSAREASSATAISLIALLAAALAPAIVAGLSFVVLGASARLALHLAAFALLLALAHVVLLGIPVVLLLQRLWRISWTSSVLAGWVIGSLPTAVWAWPLRHAQRGVTASDWNGHALVATLVNGVPTWAGWMQYARLVALAGAFGAVGGVAFWWARRLLSRHATRATGSQPP
jgi:hypothetical protein